MKSLPLPLLLATLGAAVSASAADLTPGQAKVVAQTASPDADLRLGHALSGFQVSADGDAQSVSVTSGPANSLSFKVSTPFDKSSQEGSFLSPGGRLSNGTSVEFAFSQIAPTLGALPGTPDYRVRMYKLAQQQCMAKATDADKPKCAGNYRALQKMGYPEGDEAASLIDDAFLNGPVWMWGASAGASSKHFDYRDPTSFAKSSEDHTAFKASVMGGVRLARDNLYVGAAAEYSEDYSPGRTRNLCRPLAAGGTVECISGAYAPPGKDKTSDAFAVIRWQDVNRVTPYAVELKAGYDFEHEITGAAATLYLVPDKDNKLRGGLRLSWQSDDHDPTTDDQNVTIGAFVGVPFSVF